MKISKIFVGGWFQRTTLHLSEIHDFLKYAESPLELDRAKLGKLQRALNIDDLEFVKGPLDHISFVTTGGIEVKVYEDGLILLGNATPGEPGENISELTSYYERKLSPAFSYIFSLGAPVPKELANIKTVYPYFIVLDKGKKKDVDDLLTRFGQDKHFAVKDKTYDIYRGDKLYIINNKKELLEDIEKFVAEAVFMREFRGQLHRYLNLHRVIWERIARVKERGEIKGSDIGAFKYKIERYDKTINLIEARINQMGLYVGTRESILHEDPGLARLKKVIEHKHDSMKSTLSYVKEIWRMTKSYVRSADKLFGDLQAKATESSIENLTIVTSMGVGASLIGLFTDSAPEFTVTGVWYFIALAAIGFLANKILAHIAQRRNYEIENIEIDTNIS